MQSRKVAVLAADGVDDASLTSMKDALTSEGALAKIVAPHGGRIQTVGGDTVMVDFTFLTASSVLFDGVVIPNGVASVRALVGLPKAQHFVREAYNHCKTIGADGAGVQLLQALSDAGLVRCPDDFRETISRLLLSPSGLSKR